MPSQGFVLACASFIAGLLYQRGESLSSIFLIFLSFKSNPCFMTQLTPNNVCYAQRKNQPPRYEVGRIALIAPD
jgi:hypothetical protein